MTSALDPQRAAEYLALLSPDLQAVAVLDAKGKLLAGESTDAAPGIQVTATAGGRTINASVGRQAQLGLFEHDLLQALRAMD